MLKWTRPQHFGQEICYVEYVLYSSQNNIRIKKHDFEFYLLRISVPVHLSDILAKEKIIKMNIKKITVCNLRFIFVRTDVQTCGVCVTQKGHNYSKNQKHNFKLHVRLYFYQLLEIWITWKYYCVNKEDLINLSDRLDIRILN